MPQLYSAQGWPGWYLPFRSLTSSTLVAWLFRSVHPPVAWVCWKGQSRSWSQHGQGTWTLSKILKPLTPIPLETEGRQLDVRVQQRQLSKSSLALLQSRSCLRIAPKPAPVFACRTFDVSQFALAQAAVAKLCFTTHQVRTAISAEAMQANVSKLRIIAWFCLGNPRGRQSKQFSKPTTSTNGGFQEPL